MHRFICQYVISGETLQELDGRSQQSAVEYNRWRTPILTHEMLKYTKIG